MRNKLFGRQLSLQNRMIAYFAFLLPIVILFIGLVFTFWINATTR